jgi:hypothetical protein
MKSKTNEKFIAKWQNFDGKKWKYVLVEGVLKQGTMFAVFIYVMNVFVMKFAEPSFKNLLISFLLMPVFEIPLSLFLYKKFQHHYIELTNPSQDQ